jgi:hypothetical protein
VRPIESPARRRYGSGNGMKVLLQDRLSKRYYAGPQRWVEARAEALDFGQVELAAKAYSEERARFAEIIIDDGTLSEAPPASKPSPADQAHPRR